MKCFESVLGCTAAKVCASPRNSTWFVSHCEGAESGDETSTVYTENPDGSSRLKFYWPKGILHSVWHYDDI